MPLALENESQIQPAATLHERLDTPQSHPSVQVGLTICDTRGFHGLQDLLAAIGRDAFKEARRRKQPHGARSANSVTSRNLPRRRSLAASFLIAEPALTHCEGVSPYSDAK
jgi:hypothetical protein